MDVVQLILITLRVCKWFIVSLFFSSRISLGIFLFICVYCRTFEFTANLYYGYIYIYIINNIQNISHVIILGEKNGFFHNTILLIYLFIYIHCNDNV